MAPPKTRSTRTARDEAPEAKSRILQSAEDLFASRGFEGTSTKSIAEAARVPAGLVFYHFSKKEDLLNAVLERNHLGTAIEKLLPAELNGADASAVLQVALEGLLSWIEGHRAWARLFFQELTSDRGGSNKLRAQRNNALKLLARWLECHMVLEGKPFQHAELASHLIGGSLMVAALVDKPKHKKEYVASLLQLLSRGGFDKQ